MALVRLCAGTTTLLLFLYNSTVHSLALIDPTTYHMVRRMDRYARALSKSHVLFGLFMSCLRDALLFLHPEDVKAFKQMKSDKGMADEDIENIAKSYFR